MNIYHGVPSPAKMQKCRRLAPSHTHGAEWLPHRMTDHDWPWILDNGAYSGQFNPTVWQNALADAKNKMTNQPDFVVLPDRYGSWKRTKHRHRHYNDDVPDDYRTAVVAQPGGTPEAVSRFALEIGAEVLFIGGGKAYQLEYADRLVMTGHDYGLDVHIGQPGRSLSWALDFGADSVDTTSIVRNGYWNRLRKLEASDPGTQTKLKTDTGRIHHDASTCGDCRLARETDGGVR